MAFFCCKVFFDNAICSSVALSDLFRMSAICCPSPTGIDCSCASICSDGSLASTISRIIAACRTRCNVRSMPICSNGSAVSRMPAVSINRKVTPWMLIVSSIRSRVVPAISDTSARSSLSRALSSVDLPTFGLPTMATGTPFFRMLPNRKESLSELIRCSISVSIADKRVRSANSTSSSLKSNSSSSREVNSSNCWRRSVNSFE